MGKGRGELEFFPPVPSHGFMVLDHHGELGIGVQRDSLQIPLESLGKERRERPGSAPGSGDPKSQTPSESQHSQCQISQQIHLEKLPSEKIFLSKGLPRRSKSQELIQPQICACFPTKFPFFFFGILARGSTRTGLEGKRCWKNSHSIEISCKVRAGSGKDLDGRGRVWNSAWNSGAERE